MAEQSVESFHGGIIDDDIDAPPHYAKRARNLLIDKVGKLFQRDGVKTWGTGEGISTAERIRGIHVLTYDNEGSVNGQQLLVYSHKKMFYTVPEDNFLTGLPAPNPYGEVSILATATDFAGTVSVDTHAKFQTVNQHTYVSLYNADTYASHLYQPLPRKVMVNIGASPRFAQVGLPAYAGTTTLTIAGGAANYVYYFVYEHSYSLGVTGADTTYSVLGTPSPPKLSSSSAVIGGATVTAITSLDYPTQTSATGYPLNSNFKIRIYRTKNNETVPRYVGEVAYPTTSFDDGVADASLGAPLYTADGSTPYDEPPPCRIMHVVGDCAYYSGFVRDASSSTDDWGRIRGAIQSVPGVLESAPADYIIPTPDHLTAIEGVDSYPIFFAKNACWRVEGQIDSFGNGSPVLRVISEKVGALCQNGVVKTDRGLVFAAVDGYYLTNGFTLTKLSDHCSKYYLKAWGQLTEEEMVSFLSGTYHAKSNRVFFACRSSELDADGVYPNMLHVLDLRWLDQLGHASITDLVGGENTSTLGLLGATTLAPTSLAVYNDHLLIGDVNGFILSINLLPQDPPDDPSSVDTFNAPKHYDCAADLAVLSSAAWESVSVVWDYISPAFSMSNKWATKWGTWISVMFKMITAQTRIFTQIFTYNDAKSRSDTLGSPVELHPIREEDVDPGAGIYQVDRRAKKGTLRFKFKQLQLKKGHVTLYASHPDGEEAYPAATLARSARVVTLPSGTWPSDVRGHKIYFASDVYSEGWTILTVSGDTLTVSDPDNSLPENGSYRWVIKGYDRSAGSGLGIEGYSLQYEQLGNEGDRFKQTDPKTNVTTGAD